MSKAITFANREVCNLTICDFATQRPIHILDYANATTQEVTGEQVFARGGQGYVKRVAFYGEKGGRLTIETQIMSSELFSMMTGAAIETSATYIKRLELTAAAGTLTIPAGITLAEGSINVYTEADDCGTPLAVTVSGGSVTLPSGHTTGKYILYGIENINSGVKKMSVKSTTFPKAVTIYGETLMTGEDGHIYPYKMVVYKAAPEQSFQFGFSSSGDPVSLTLNFELLANTDNEMLDILLIEDQDLATLSSIAITTAPNKTTYATGEAFNPEGMVVTATYSDSTTGVVAGYTIDPSTNLQPTDTAVVVMYTEGGIVKTAVQAISVT